MATQAAKVKETVQEDRFKQQMRAYDRWKVEIAHTIKDFQNWLEEYKMGNPESELRIFEAINALESDKLTIAFVAEFSRGKTELINAIFFADYKRRLLPSEAGRTTMCPTELFYDTENDQAYIRLLPIDTRLEDTSIAQYKRDPNKWKTIYLDINAPDQMEEALHEVVKTKLVPLEDARKLGLYDDEMHKHLKKDDKPPTEIEVPLWRHAEISFPHPLLQQGVTILDTPGLNALGSEPELTLNMLPSAQAVLFVLAADTGVTRSDLDIWQYHIKGFRNKNAQGLLVALNKIDTLWDEMKDEKSVLKTIETQKKATSEMLKVDANTVFPVSAQKGLLGKIKGDHDLLVQSNLLVLEAYLADKVLPNRQMIVWQKIVDEIGMLITNNLNIVGAHLKNRRKQLEEFGSLSSKNTDVFQQMMKKTREERALYHKNMESVQASKRKIEQQAKLLLEALSIEAVDKLIGLTRKAMKDSWTTAGLKNGIKVFFDSIRDTIQVVARQTEESHKLIEGIYQKFNELYNLPNIAPKAFSVKKYTTEIDRFYLEAEEFRNSPVTTMTEQSFVIKKFFISLVSQVRNVFFQAHQEADLWFKELVNPLMKQVQDHKQQIEQRLETLTKINESKSSLDSKIGDLEKHAKILEGQYFSLKKMKDTLKSSAPNGTEIAKKEAAA